MYVQYVISSNAVFVQLFVIFAVSSFTRNVLKICVQVKFCNRDCKIRKSLLVKQKD